MITGSEIYWITRLDGIRSAGMVIFIIACIVDAIGLIVGLCMYCDSTSDSNQEKKGWRVLRGVLLLFIIPTLLLSARMFVPTTKEMCAIVAIPIVVNNKEVQKIPETVLELANEWINELRPKTPAGAIETNSSP